MARKAIALTLIVGSLIFAVLIFVGDKSLIKIPKVDSTISKIESLPDSLSNAIPRTKNFTQEIAKDIAQELAKNNLNKTTNSIDQLKIGVGKPEELANKVLSDQLSSLNVENLTPEIKIEDLKIVKTSDKQVAENYLKNFKAILKDNFSGLNTDLSQPTVDDFQRLTAAYQKVIAGFYSLIVPEDLSRIHREEIRLLTIQKNIFENLADYQTDPLKAYISAQVFQEVSRQLLALNKAIVGYVTQNDLKI